MVTMTMMMMMMVVVVMVMMTTTTTMMMMKVTLMTIVINRFGATLKYIELPSELITAPVLHELSNKCPALRSMTLDFSSAMQLHDFNDLNSFPCNLRSLCICLSEVIFLEGFMRRIYSCLPSIEVLHLIGELVVLLLWQGSVGGGRGWL